MFVRKKKNISGVISVQVIDKSTGKYRVAKTIGSSSDVQTVEDLFFQGKKWISQQNNIGFNAIKDDILRHLVVSRICHPQSKVATVDYLKSYFDEDVELHKIYRCFILRQILPMIFAKRASQKMANIRFHKWFWGFW